MNNLKVIGLLRALSLKTADVSLKSEIEVIIKELEATEQGDGINNNKSSPDQKKTTAYKIAEGIGKFFMQVGSRIIADSISDVIQGPNDGG